MENLDTITIDQLEQTCKNVGCKYVQMDDLQGKKIVGVPAGAISLKQKFNEIETYLKNNSKEPFFLITFTKSKKGKNYKEYKYYLSNAQASSTPMSAAPVYNYNVPFDADRITKQNLQDGNAIAQLSADLKFTQFQLDECKSKLAEYENAADESAETLADEKPNALMGFAKDVLPQFMPLAEKYFELAEKKLALQAMALQNKVSAPQSKRHPFRPLPTLNEVEKLNSYLDWLEKCNDVLYAKELAYVQINRPEIYDTITTAFDADNKLENE
jgi:hypothetical protein